MLSLVIGRKMVIMHKWDAQEALRLIEQERITWFNGVPTMSAELQAAAANYQPGHLLPDRNHGRRRRAPARPGEKNQRYLQEIRAGYRLWPDRNQRAGHGQCRCLLYCQARQRRSRGACGDGIPDCGRGRQPLPAGARGELCIKSPANILGYWNKPEATAEAFVDGWFHTGDVAYLDEEGFLYIVDRIKDIIIRGGENISCLEVEAAIYAHPGVHEVAVFGLPDARLGEIVGAAVVLREGVELTADELRAVSGANTWRRSRYRPVSGFAPSSCRASPRAKYSSGSSRRSTPPTAGR